MSPKPRKPPAGEDGEVRHAVATVDLFSGAPFDDGGEGPLGSGEPLPSIPMGALLGDGRVQELKVALGDERVALSPAERMYLVEEVSDLEQRLDQLREEKSEWVKEWQARNEETKNKLAKVLRELREDNAQLRMFVRAGDAP
jgi:hypothetical protein